METQPLIFDTFSKDKGCVARNATINPTAHDTSIKHVGLQYKGFGQPDAHESHLHQRVSLLALKAGQHKLTVPQMRSLNNSAIVPMCTYAPTEAGKSAYMAHRINTTASIALRRAAHELPSASATYLYVHRSLGGGGCVSVQQKRLAGIASDLHVALTNPETTQSAVYRDRYMDGATGKKGPNFVRDAIAELVDYGIFIRHRKYELVARVIDVKSSTWRSPQRCSAFSCRPGTVC